MSDAGAESADILVVGAGIVGLACAYEAVERGLSVVVVERDERAAGASIRNFGHACATAQSGQALAYGRVARDTWLRLAEAAGFWARPTGTLMVARGEDELAVLEEFAELRGDEAQLLTVAEVARHAPAGPGVVGGARLPRDLRVDPRESIPKIAEYLATRGVRFHWNTTAHAVETGRVATSRGVLSAGQIILATGHDVDRHFPGLAAAGVVPGRDACRGRAGRSRHHRRRDDDRFRFRARGHRGSDRASRLTAQRDVQLRGGTVFGASAQRRNPATSA